LARHASAISVADVIQAVDGPVTVTACSTDDHNCDQYSKCSVRDPLWKIKNRIVDALNTVSVLEMAQESDAPATPQTHTVSRMVFVPPFGEEQR
jgi:DNA-binding IscR family transcriptional regulator